MKVKDYFVEYKKGYFGYLEIISLPVETLLLAIMYILGFGLAFVITRFSKRPLWTVIDRDVRSYWEPYEKQEQDYYSQY